MAIKPFYVLNYDQRAKENDLPRFRYFASRPEILTNNNGSGGGGHDAQTAVAVAASSAVREAVVKHPEATAKFVSAGLKHLAAGESGGNSNNNRPSGRTVESGAGVSVDTRLLLDLWSPDFSNLTFQSRF